MREFKYTADEVMNLGYHEVYRLFGIADELRARDLKEQIIAADFAGQPQDQRDKVWDWISSRQHRMIGKKNIPQEVLEKFAEAFNNG